MESCSREMGSLGLSASWSSLRFAPLSFPFDRMSSLSLYSIQNFDPLTLLSIPLFLPFPSKLFVRTPHKPLQVDVTSTTSILFLSLSLVSDVDRTLSSFFVPFFRSMFRSFLYLCSHFATLQLRNLIMLIPITLLLSSELQFVDKMI